MAVVSDVVLWCGVCCLLDDFTIADRRGAMAAVFPRRVGASGRLGMDVVRPLVAQVKFLLLECLCTVYPGTWAKLLQVSELRSSVVAS